MLGVEALAQTVEDGERRFEFLRRLSRSANGGIELAVDIESFSFGIGMRHRMSEGDCLIKVFLSVLPAFLLHGQERLHAQVIGSIASPVHLPVTLLEVGSCSLVITRCKRCPSKQRDGVNYAGWNEVVVA